MDNQNVPCRAALQNSRVLLPESIYLDPAISTDRIVPHFYGMKKYTVGLSMHSPSPTTELPMISIRYLLHGPPGTGKSTMIAAMANLLSYDVYDLELTAVQSNADLKRLMNRIPCNSILVIEDIDCSSEITNQREKNNQGDKGARRTREEVTLSGLLNCIDGLFSASDGGILMVFTTNHVELLDKALLRTGRMDKHIEMSYCGFKAFRILAKNYLGMEEHELFGRIEEMFKESRITPADVAEELIARSGIAEDRGIEDCLNKLIQVLEEKQREEAEAEAEAGENGECK